MEFAKQDNQIVIRLSRGEHIIETLTTFVTSHQIKGGFFVGLGAAKDVELAHYSVADKKYSSKKIQEPLEITNLTGSIAWFEKQPIIHCHGSFSDPEMNSFGGHLVEATVTGTLEIILFSTKDLTKQLDEETGLKVFDLGITNEN